jgi:DNA-binding CsgD family transcriptional regulator/5-methylcytosine-specific restriction endonuclease McrA
MFVSNVRSAVQALLAAGLTMNEVAHRLGVARSTVGYHVAALREAERAPARNRNSSRPKSPPDVTRARVLQLLDAGHSRAAVARLLGLRRSTVTYHAHGLGLEIFEHCARRYDWAAISAFYEDGNSTAACRARFGFTRNTWHDAIRRGLITPRPGRLPLNELLVAGPRRNRGHLKRRLFDAGVKTRRCESCGLTEWQGSEIPLTLHHINGDRHDNRPENLQILCANCHSQTDTWSGRNLRKRDSAA